MDLSCILNNYEPNDTEMEPNVLRTPNISTIQLLQWSSKFSNLDVANGGFKASSNNDVVHDCLSKPSPCSCKVRDIPREPHPNTSGSLPESRYELSTCKHRYGSNTFYEKDCIRTYSVENDCNHSLATQHYKSDINRSYHASMSRAIEQKRMVASPPNQLQSSELLLKPSETFDSARSVNELHSKYRTFCRSTFPTRKSLSFVHYDGSNINFDSFGQPNITILCNDVQREQKIECSSFKMDKHVNLKKHDVDVSSNNTYLEPTGTNSKCNSNALIRTRDQPNVSGHKTKQAQHNYDSTKMPNGAFFDERKLNSIKMMLEGKERSEHIRVLDANTGEELTYDTNLRRRKHTFECKSCGRKLGRKSDMVRHLQTHLNIRPYICHTCCSSFVQRSALNVHLRIHTGEKPYSCSRCSRRFSDSSSLARHIKSPPTECKLVEKYIHRKPNFIWNR